MSLKKSMSVKSIFRYIKALLSKLNFLLGRNPVIVKYSESGRYIPQQYESVLLISADFELAWASRYNKKKRNTLRPAVAGAKTERGNIPEILKLCKLYNIPVTWATIGHLFLDSCSELSGKKHPEIPEISPYKGRYWDYSGSDWFEHDPCTNLKEDPDWYAPDLVKLIINSGVKHEIGCHTFSHIDCRDNVCPPGLFRAELRECKRLSAGLGINMKTFVHPGHTVGNLEVLAEEGFTNFRSNYRNILGYPKKQTHGLWELEQTAELVYRKEWSVDYHVFRYIEIIKRAIKTKKVCVFWFHPSFDPVVIEKIMPEVFKFLDDNRDKIWITTHNEYIQWLC
jgi:peptidoglycan/xylan/chitin deacetylase (PgdA/CDA1 family)